MLAQIRNWLARRKPENTPEKIKARQEILGFQTTLKNMIDNGEMRSVEDQCTLRHLFASTDHSNLHLYGRQIFLPKGSWIVGKLHKHPCLNFVMKGRVICVTEHERKEIVGPCSFVGEPGVKRALWILEDTVWATVNLTKYSGEENLDLIENELIAKDYEDLGFLTTLQLGEEQ